MTSGFKFKLVPNYILHVCQWTKERFCENLISNWFINAYFPWEDQKVLKSDSCLIKVLTNIAIEMNKYANHMLLSECEGKSRLWSVCIIYF